MSLMTPRIVLVSSLIAALAACSSAPAPSMSASDLAAKAGCGATWAPGSTQTGIKEGGKCQIDGVTIYLYTFADDAARDAWMKVAKGVGGLGTFGVGPAWVIQGLQDGPARKAITAAGGTVS